ncbi:MAG: hypothetical protein ABUS79_05635 [Pseudomonadota bacterium]
MGVASNASAQLKGSDTLDKVTDDVIAACPAVVGLTYVGGGSSAGQAAMTGAAPTQRVAPMSRELNGVACTNDAQSAQVLIGLDGISVVGANQTGASPFTCPDNISGPITIPVNPATDPPLVCGAADGCSTPNQYTFADWKDVLAMLYAGQNHAAGSLLVGGARNPARLNCRNPVRQYLADNYGQVFTNRSCHGVGCVSLNHIFRRDDLSGTTDAFVAIVGLTAIPGFAPAFATGGGTVANPFCNAGTALMFKGDADYLDLDPIRRLCRFKLTNPRANIEDVCEGYATPNNTAAACTSAFPNSGPGAPTEIERSAFNGRGLISLANNATSRADLADDIRREDCLGLVLPISIPQNIALSTLYPTQSCTPTFRALAIPANGAICPDGLTPPCALPAVNNGPGVSPTFDCISQSATPAGAGLRDGRIFNTFVFNSTGQIVRDNFNNPNFVDPREPRSPRAFFRIHSWHVDTTNPVPATGGPCQLSDDTRQIGCLVKASPCSIGFAGREAIDGAAPFQNFGFQIQGITPSNGNIDSFAYPLARKLWFNSYVPGGVAFGPTLSGNEAALTACFSDPTKIDGIMLGRNFRPVPAAMTPRLRACPAGAP